MTHGVRLPRLLFLFSQRFKVYGLLMMLLLLFFLFAFALGFEKGRRDPYYKKKRSGPKENTL
jgi:hypothetical protein